MKKLLILITVLFAVTFTVNAQTSLKFGFGFHMPSEVNEGIEDFTLKGGYIGYSQEGTNGSIWGVFADIKAETIELKVSQVDAFSSNYEINFLLSSFGVEYSFSPGGVKNIFLGGEAFYSILSISSNIQGAESESYSGFGFAPKAGLRFETKGGYISVEGKYIILEVGNEGYDLGGLGLQTSFWLRI